jgi:NarL family two-component system sensor histidine kinase YdfH
MHAIQQDGLAIARDLHDTVVQDLIATIMQLRSAIEPRQPAERLRYVVEGLTGAERALSRARALLDRLRRAGPWIDDFDEPTSLLGGVNQIFDEVLRHSGLNATVSCPQEVPLSTSLMREVLYIVREATNNVVRHAHARSIYCTVEPGIDSLRVEIGDDGIGYPHSTKSADFGVLGMRERAQMIGASFKIKSAFKRGSSVLLTIPLSGNRKRPDLSVPKFALSHQA